MDFEDEDSSGSNRRYRGYLLYVLDEHGFSRDKQGRYEIVVAFSPPGSSIIEYVPVPGRFARTFDEAVELSLEYGRRLIDADFANRGF